MIPDNILSCWCARGCVVRCLREKELILCELISLVCTREGGGGGTSDPCPLFIYYPVHPLQTQTVSRGISETLWLPKYQLSASVAATGSLLEAELHFAFLWLNTYCCKKIFNEVFTDWNANVYSSTVLPNPCTMILSVGCQLFHLQVFCGLAGLRSVCMSAAVLCILEIRHQTLSLVHRCIISIPIVPLG